MTTSDSIDPVAATAGEEDLPARSDRIVAPASRESSMGRVDSIDALRGLTILTMVFVNDVGSAALAWRTTSNLPTRTV